MLTLRTRLNFDEWKLINHRKPAGAIQINGNATAKCIGTTPGYLDGFEYSGLYEDRQGMIWIVQRVITLPTWKAKVIGRWPDGILKHDWHNITPASKAINQVYRIWRYEDIYGKPSSFQEDSKYEAESALKEAHIQTIEGNKLEAYEAWRTASQHYALYYLGRPLPVLEEIV